jgi:hypothetical protein
MKIKNNKNNNMLGQAGRAAALGYMIELMKLCQHDFEVKS